ncbi:hypothetical protein GUJ93_ZPchr0458g22270 [Zizania palustris]|uniref:Uncharacterized protein n=1 Tax=Zizania palustris TaxID=103762 RepID=A0A8J5RL01_ZIZPA|nr:hypothetical protein GUJ93_ZPchr0458g22270 [Zizania palustris]
MPLTCGAIHPMEPTNSGTSRSTVWYFRRSASRSSWTWVESWSGKAASYRRWRNCSPRHSHGCGPDTGGARVSVDRSAALAPGDSIQEDSLLLQSPRQAYAAIFLLSKALRLFVLGP